MADHLIPAREIRTETRVLNSRFVATVTPVFTVQEARAFVERIKNEFPDATHHVPAYLIGHGASTIAHCSDDGEPSGTAGRPALAVLKGSGLGDVAVVVTRYYGGTKLGTGGLVRAYGDAVRQVLSELPHALKVSTHTILVETPYPHLERVRLSILAHKGEILDQDYPVQVSITIRIAQERLPAFQVSLRELSNGSLQAQILSSDEDTIMPVDGPGSSSFNTATNGAT